MLSSLGEGLGLLDCSGAMILMVGPGFGHDTGQGDALSAANFLRLSS